MSTCLDLLEVDLLPSSFIKDAMSGSWRVLAEGAEKKDGKIVFGFKIVGENRLIVVLQGGTDSAVKFLNAAFGNQVAVSCTPLRKFEHFAANVLGCQVKKPIGKFTKDIHNSTGSLFWLKFTFGYEGLHVGQFINAWKDDSDFWLNLKHKNDIQIELFKVVCQKEILMFVRVPNADVLDDLLFTAPIMRTLGSQVKVVVKSIIFINDYFAMFKSKGKLK